MVGSWIALLSVLPPAQGGELELPLPDPHPSYLGRLGDAGLGRFGSAKRMLWRTGSRFYCEETSYQDSRGFVCEWETGDLVTGPRRVRRLNASGVWDVSRDGKMLCGMMREDPRSKAAWVHSDHRDVVWDRVAPVADAFGMDRRETGEPISSSGG